MSINTIPPPLRQMSCKLPVCKFSSSSPSIFPILTIDLVSTVIQLHISQPVGDILVFMDGQAIIDAAVESIEETCKKLGNRIKPLIVAPIYSTLPPEMQEKIFVPAPPGSRKCVIATNIAETSLTIDGIVYVVDSGLVKELTWTPATGSSSLQTVECSRAAAEQRAGRAGRTQPGKALRLYTKQAYFEMDPSAEPEILRTDLAPVVLSLQCLGIRDVVNFDWLDAPSSDALIAAMSLLYQLGGLSSQGEVTRLGRQMIEIPAHPRLATALISGSKFGCVQEVLTVIAMLDESGALWIRGKGEARVHSDNARANFMSKGDGGIGGDYIQLLNVYNEWQDSDFSPIFAKDNFLSIRSLNRARLVREQLESLLERVEIDKDSSVGSSDPVPILKALLSGFFTNTAVLSSDGQHYRTLGSNQQVRIHPSSCLTAMDHYKPKMVMFHEMIVTSGEFIRGVSGIEASWVSEVAPHFWKSHNIDKMSANKKKMPKAQAVAAR
jgi:pre-mRNA-splicing factor ATP-dependent RNA helicase DHX16